jgi:hypothetical protein
MCKNLQFISVCGCARDNPTERKFKMNQEAYLNRAQNMANQVLGEDCSDEMKMKFMLGYLSSRCEMLEEQLNSSRNAVKVLHKELSQVLGEK